jgi:hypothetical protein
MRRKRGCLYLYLYSFLDFQLINILKTRFVEAWKSKGPTIILINKYFTERR